MPLMLTLKQYLDIQRDNYITNSTMSSFGILDTRLSALGLLQRVVISGSTIMNVIEWRCQVNGIKMQQ